MWAQSRHGQQARPNTLHPCHSPETPRSGPEAAWSTAAGPDPAGSGTKKVHLPPWSSWAGACGPRLQAGMGTWADMVSPRDMCNYSWGLHNAALRGELSPRNRHWNEACPRVEQRPWNHRPDGGCVETLGPRRQCTPAGPFHASGKKDLLALWVENQRKSPITHWELRQLRKQDFIVGQFQRCEALKTWEPPSAAVDGLECGPRHGPAWPRALQGAGMLCFLVWMLD